MGRFFFPLMIIAITIVAFVTYAVEQNNGVTPAYYNVTDHGWSMELPKGEESTPIISYYNKRSTCINFSIADMSTGGYKVYRRQKFDSGTWSEVSNTQIKPRAGKTAYKFKALRDIKIEGELSIGRGCGLQVPLYRKDLPGQHVTASLQRVRYNIRRGQPLYVRFPNPDPFKGTKAKCIHNRKGKSVRKYTTHPEYSRSTYLIFSTQSGKDWVEIWASPSCVASSGVSTGKTYGTIKTKPLKPPVSTQGSTRKQVRSPSTSTSSSWKKDQEQARRRQEQRDLNDR